MRDIEEPQVIDLTWNTPKPISNSEKKQYGHRHSELSTQINPKDVVNSILDTQVALPIRQILGTSRELSNTLLEVMKQKNTIAMTAQNQVIPIMPSEFRTKEVMNNQVQEEPGSSRDLIKWNVTIRGRPVTAIIDTGSEVNLINDQIAAQLIGVPMNTTKGIFMKDINGGVGRLEGCAEEIEIKCGAVKTKADFFISKTAEEQDPTFEILLGRPWQRSNRVDIKEDKIGTFLIFKDPITWRPKWKMLVVRDESKVLPFFLERQSRSFQVSMITMDANHETSSSLGQDLELDSEPETESEYSIQEDPNPPLQDLSEWPSPESECYELSNEDLEEYENQ